MMSRKLILSSLMVLIAISIVSISSIRSIYAEDKLELNIITPSCGETFAPEDYVYFHGQVTVGGAGISDVSIEVHIASPRGMYYNGTSKTDSDGFFTYPIVLGEDAIAGQWPILVKADLSGYEGDHKECHIVIENGQIEVPEQTEPEPQEQPEQTEGTIDQEDTGSVNQTETEIEEDEVKEEEPETGQLLLPSINWTIIFVTLIICITLIVISTMYLRRKQETKKSRKRKK
jgi:hypothetical protein